jgi:hypothetical protein
MTTGCAQNARGARACDEVPTAADPSEPEVQVIAVRPLPADRRTRVVLADVVVGPVVLVVGVARLRRQVVVRLPVAEDGSPAIGISPELLARIEAAALAAVQADPAARAHLSRRGRH